MKKFVIYTARFGQPGRFNTPNISITDVDRLCFTDLDIESDEYRALSATKSRAINTNFYQIRRRMLNHLTAIRRQRLIKICIPDEIFNNYEYSVYVDCKRPMSVDFEYLLSHMDHGSDFLTRRHKRRSCIYDEGLYCIKKKKDSEVIISKQLEFYRSENYPAHNGLHRSGFLLRRHTASMKEFSRLWWRQIERFSHRDQISLPYIAWKHNIKISLYKRMR